MIRLIFWTLLANALMWSARFFLRLGARCMSIAESFASWCRAAERHVDVLLARAKEEGWEIPRRPPKP